MRLPREFSARQMATMPASESVQGGTPTAIRSVRKRTDDYFFCCMALLILAIVFIGFARSYYLAGMLRAHLPTVLIHVHGALMTCWILLFVAQIVLVSAKRIDWHMRLGVAGMVLAGVLVPVALATLIQSVRRRVVIAFGVDALFAGDVLQLLSFSALIIWGFCVRRDGAAHKRLMLLAMVPLLGPAVARWPFAFANSVLGIFLLCDAVPVLLIFFDLWSFRKVRLVTACGVLLILATQVSSLPLAHTAFWHHVTVWVQSV